MASSLLSVADAARELHVSARRVRQFIEAGRLRAHKLGRDYVIVRADLDAVRHRPGPGRPTTKRTRRAK